MPKVSIILPNFNHASFLERRIESILNQTYQDFELILLDDCSTDNSVSILKKYSTNSKVSHLILNEVNTGSTFKQWDKGFSLAKGEYIWIAESDDWCEKTLLENLVPALEDNPNVVLAYVQSVMVSEVGNITYKTKAGKYIQTMSGRDFVASRMFGDPVLINSGMVVFRKSALAKVDNVYKTIPGVGDWVFWINIALQGDVYICGKYLNYFFRHEGTVTSKSVVTGNDFCQACKVFKYVEERTNPSASEITKALTLRVNEFCMLRKVVKDKMILASAKNHLFALNCKAKKMYYKRLIKNFLYIDRWFQ